MEKWSNLVHTPHYLRSPLIPFAAVVACLGLAVRVFTLLASGNRPVGPLSGTGDQDRYRALAESVFRGDGLTYAGQPTALRAPTYPVLLAAAHWTFGAHYFLAMRILQLLASLLLVYVCVKLGRRLFDEGAGLLAGALALALPTLVFVENELQTEAFAALLTTLFLFSALEVFDNPSKHPFSLGVYSGIAALFRFNAALLSVLAALGLLWRDRGPKRALLLALVAGAVVLPWLVRNELVFHGRVLYSTHGGINLLQGVLTPQGRAQADEGRLVKNAVGWEHTDIETNSNRRLEFPSEDVLDRQARAAASIAWGGLDWKGRIRLLSSKVTCFWLSTDQLLSTSGFSKRQRYLRAAGVLMYWVVLLCAGVGWRKLLTHNRRVAMGTALYCVAITAAHLPFVMNTRLRIPFLDPLLAVLAAGGIAAMVRNGARRVGHNMRENSGTHPLPSGSEGVHFSPPSKIWTLMGRGKSSAAA